MSPVRIHSQAVNPGDCYQPRVIGASSPLARPGSPLPNSLSWGSRSPIAGDAPWPRCFALRPTRWCGRAVATRDRPSPPPPPHLKRSGRPTPAPEGLRGVTPGIHPRACDPRAPASTTTTHFRLAPAPSATDYNRLARAPAFGRRGCIPGRVTALPPHPLYGIRMNTWPWQRQRWPLPPTAAQRAPARCAGEGRYSRAPGRPTNQPELVLSRLMTALTPHPPLAGTNTRLPVPPPTSPLTSPRAWIPPSPCPRRPPTSQPPPPLPAAPLARTASCVGRWWRLSRLVNPSPAASDRPMLATRAVLRPLLVASGSRAIGESRPKLKLSGREGVGREGQGQR
jgi:hypothetical protein